MKIRPAKRKYPDAVSIDPVTTRQEIQRRLNIIRRYVSVRDHEAAHWERDKLWRYVLCAVAQGCQGCIEPEVLSAYAELALLTESIDIKTWCA